MELTKKTIIITGAAHGLGRELALLLDGLGCALVLIDCDRVGLAELSHCLARPPQLVPCDLSDLQERKTLVRSLQAQPSADILINCAGIGSHSLLCQLSLEEVEHILQVNTLAPLELIAGLTPLRLVVNIGSVAGEMPVPSMGLYAASKSSLHAFTNSIRLEGVPTLLVILGSLRGTDFVKSIRHPHTSQPHWYRNLDLDASLAAQEIVRAMQLGKAKLVLPRWYLLVFAAAALFLPLARALGYRYKLEHLNERSR